MNKTLQLALVAALPLLGQDITGDWIGTLHTGAVNLRLVVHIAKAEEGALSATLDSPDQGAKGIPCSGVELKQSKLSFSLMGGRASFEGLVNQDSSEISGTFTQGASLPLVFKRATAMDAAPPRRPQNPTKPYPYREEDLTYENKSAGIRLGATLTLPNGAGPFPAAILITGSGQQDRDETLLGHKPFLVLADYLTRRGIAVLRSDDRGAGTSGGDFAKSTTADFATDTEAAIGYLKTRHEIDPHKIGLIGHSEGGEIAPMVAARNKDVAFIVMMAGPGVPGDQIIVAQVIAGAEAEGMPHDQALQAGAKQREILDLLMKEKDQDAVKQKFRSMLGARGEPAYAQMSSPWYRYFLSYDPAPALRKVTCPVLALIGEKDSQVPPALNIPAIRKAVEAGGNKQSEVEEMPGLNHLFQTAKTGAFSEYSQIEETISPKVLDKIATWIKTVVSR